MLGGQVCIHPFEEDRQRHRRYSRGCGGDIGCYEIYHNRVNRHIRRTGIKQGGYQLGIPKDYTAG